MYIPKIKIFYYRKRVNYFFKVWFSFSCYKKKDLERFYFILILKEKSFCLYFVDCITVYIAVWVIFVKSREIKKSLKYL